MNFLLTVYTRV